MNYKLKLLNFEDLCHVRRQTIWTIAGSKLSHSLPDGNLFSILLSPSIDGFTLDSFPLL